MRVSHLLQSLLPAALLAAEASAYSDPEACSGDCWTHDPSVVRRESDGVYFRFSTGNLIGIFKADALTGPWTYEGAAIPDGSIIDLAGNDDLWAPDVHYFNDEYIMYYTVSTSGSQDSAIGYATSSTMEYGSWTDHGATGVASTSAKAYNAIDASVILDESGTYHMSFGSFWEDLYTVELNSAATKASGSSVHIAYNSTADHPVEGSFLFYYDDYYYLFFSSGACCDYNVDLPAKGDEYKVFVCRSTSVAGTYLDAEGKDCLTDNGGTLVLASHGTVYGPGGQGVFTDPTYGTVIYYHYADTTIGLADSEYQFGWNKITWSDGWPTV